MVSKMEVNTFLNLNIGELILLTPSGLPSAELVDSSVDFLLTWLAILIPSLAGGVQILRKLMGLFHQNQVLRHLSKIKGKLRVPSSMSLNFRSEYFRILENVDLSLRKLENFIASRFPGDKTLLQALFDLQGKIYHHLEKRFHRRGSD